MALAQVLALPITRCELILPCGKNELTCVKHSEQCLTHSKHSGCLLFFFNKLVPVKCLEVFWLVEGVHVAIRKGSNQGDSGGLPGGDSLGKGYRASITDDLQHDGDGGTGVQRSQHHRFTRVPDQPLPALLCYA